MNMMKSELLSILPVRYRSHFPDPILTRLQEIRLRLDQPVRLVFQGTQQTLTVRVSADDLRFCINSASRYSPWNASTMKDGYLTAPGGHRIGLCGESGGEGLRNLTSLCIRVCKNLTGIGDHLMLRNSALIIGPPGSGKTTLLRELIRSISAREKGSVSVVDERCEIFPLSNGMPCFETGPCTDVLSGREKAAGIDMILRSMGPEWIAMDEITAQCDCEALLRAGWCGVKLLATAHASSLSDLHSREIYRPLISSGIFQSVIIMHPDQSCHQERI